MGRRCCSCTGIRHSIMCAGTLKNIRMPTQIPTIMQARAASALEVVAARARATASAFGSVLALVVRAAYEGELDSSKTGLDMCIVASTLPWGAVQKHINRHCSVTPRKPRITLCNSMQHLIPDPSCPAPAAMALARWLSEWCVDGGRRRLAVVLGGDAMLEMLLYRACQVWGWKRTGAE